MSSNYAVLCLSHDPAIIATDPGYNRPEMAEEAIRQGISGHADCDLAIGRFSGAFVEFGCPARRDQPTTRVRCHHSSTAWTDSEWLTLLAAAYQSTDPAMPDVIKAGHHWCLPWERLRRLRDELGFTITPDPATDDTGNMPDGPPRVWHQRSNGTFVMESPGGLVTVPGVTTPSQLQAFADCFWAPAKPSATEHGR